MKQIYNYYKDVILKQSELFGQLRSKIHLIGTLKLLLVIGMIGTIWILKSYAWWQLVIGEIMLAIPLIILTVTQNRLFTKKLYCELMIKLCENEIRGLDYDFSAFKGCPEKIDANHSFTLDLDIFGKQSVFQSLNRTVTANSEQILAEWFINPLQAKDDILDRQEAVKELSALTPLRQHFFVTGSIKKDQKEILSSSTEFVGPEMNLSRPFLWKTLAWIVPGGWLALIIATLFFAMPASMLGVYLILTLAISMGASKEINSFYNKVDKLEKWLVTYSELIAIIEEQSFQSTILKELHSKLSSNSTNASSAIKKFSRLIGDLDQTFTFMGIVLNMLWLQNIHTTIKLQKWNNLFGKEMKRWLKAVERFDALCSLGGFAFNHPDYIYPTITEKYFEMEGTGLGHPLLDRNKCVTNNVNIPHSSWFLIITGANMAGKSTYLRTVGVNFLLSCVGTPVFAEKLSVYPAKLVTSLRTSDSLTGNESYFFAELKRLKMIIDKLRDEEKLFIILDEILKGTNSLDKQKGSLALVEQLIGYDACGIIATHDLVLGNLEAKFPSQIKNYRFEADICNNELSFSYTLREGVAQNMNACFLMKKMGIYFKE